MARGAFFYPRAETNPKNKPLFTMKNYLKNLLLAGALFALVFVAAAPASAQTPQSLSFIGTGGDGYNLAITPSATFSYGGTNTYAKGYHSVSTLTPYTNSTTGLVQSNWLTTNAPNWFTNTSGISDVGLWANRDGTPPNANIAVDIVGINAAFTNIVTFNFATVPGIVPPGSGLTLNQSTSSNGTFAFAVTGNGTTDVVLTTNVSTTILQGNRTLRLVSVVTTNAGTNGSVVGCWFNGFKPTGAE